MKKGTSLQKIVDAVKIKLPNENLRDKENQIVQLLTGAVAKCYRKTYEDIDFFYDPEILDGYFYHDISPATIELLSLYIVKDYLTRNFSALNNRKKYLGTSAFNKIPSNKEEYDFLLNQLNYWDSEIEKFEMQFPDYSEER